MEDSRPIQPATGENPFLSRPAGDFMEQILAAAREASPAAADGSAESSPAAAEPAALPCDIAPRELPPGTQLRGYRLLRCIGQGGFGVTYLAEEPQLSRKVVIKENFPSGICYRREGTHQVCLHHPEQDAEGFEWAMNNFLREVRLLGTVDHPSIAKVYSYFEAYGTSYYVLEYINGVSLGKLAESYAQAGQRLPQASLFGMLVRLLDALDYLHARKLLHRDIKPDNILITRTGLPVLIDFGAAREEYGDLGNTVVESPGFSPSEQGSAAGNMGPWTDLYALGATLYYILTGECLPSCRQRELYDTADPLSLNPALAGEYCREFLQTIERAIVPAPEARYQSAAEWLADLARLPF